MSTPTNSHQNHTPLIERVLAYAATTIMVVAVLSFLTTLIVAMVAGREVLAEGLWQWVTFVSYYGLPTGFVLLILLLILNFSRRGKAR